VPEYAKNGFPGALQHEKKPEKKAIVSQHLRVNTLRIQAITGGLKQNSDQME